MTDNTINEKAIHEQMVTIDIKIISLSGSLQDLCKYLVVDKQHSDTVLTIESLRSKLDSIKLQLSYIDDMIYNGKLQRESKPVIIKRGKSDK